MKVLKTIIVIAGLCLLYSCQKYTPPPHGCSAYMPYRGIRANDAPSVTGASDSLPYYIVTSVTSYSGLNQGISTLFASSDCYYVNIYRNTLGPNLLITYTTAYSTSYHSNVYSLNGYILDQAGYGMFAIQSDPTQGISLAGPLTWSRRDSTTTTPIFIDSSAAPLVPTMTSDTVIHMSADYTLQGTGPVSGDSVIFILGDSVSTIRKVLGPGSTSCTFTAAEMSGFKPTHSSNPGIAQIATYRKYINIVNGQRAYFLKEACFSQYVRIVN